MAFAWIPKATVQAALSSSILGMTAAMTTMTAEDRKEFDRYGYIILTTSVLAIILSAPAGAILINTLGKLFLTYDGDDPEVLAQIKQDLKMAGKDCDVCEDDELTKAKKMAKTNKIASVNEEYEKEIPNED